MMTCQDSEARLSEFIDGALSVDARRALDEHLSSCPRCRGLARDFERIRQTARALGPIPPPDHIWLEVAGQIRPAVGADTLRRVASTRQVALRQWLSLAAMLVLVTLGAYFIVRTPAPPSPTQPGNAAASATVEGVTDELNQAMRHYENAIGQLEGLAKETGTTLDPAIAATLQRNIQTIDGAIAESRAALGQDPTSVPARESLFEALKNKVGVLQATLDLMNEMRKGDQAAAADAAAAFGKKS